MGDEGDQKKKIAILGVSSILLVAMVVAVAIGVSNNPTDSGGEGGDKSTSTSNQISTTNKAVKALCAPSVYKDTCASLASPNPRRTPRTRRRSSRQVILAPGFIAKNMGFENSAGAVGHQAVAYRSQSDNSVVFNCQFDGYQDTLYPQTYRQFFRDCVITGTIDFIFGVARTVLQNCTMIVRKPMDNQQCIVTAEGRQDPNGDSAIVIMNSHIMGDPAYLPVKDQLKAYLGRPWKEYSRTVIMHTVIDGMIAPEGWLEWQGDLGLKTLYYAEFENTGPGSVQTGRVTWPGVKHIGAADAANFAPGKLYVEGDDWITATSVPYTSGMGN
ncbi:unnamed protein product [Linum tenue]|uniref:Pectinesterase n=1 Tax=Linum tenue TaxID=586396 RepID=A0AAV0S1T0_9ROSI|nr:unnamed protein product [Linum tenue]